MPAIQPRRGLVLMLFLLCIFFSITLLFRYRQHSDDLPGAIYDHGMADSTHIPAPVLKGDVIASKLGNETLKYVTT